MSSAKYATADPDHRSHPAHDPDATPAGMDTVAATISQQLVVIHEETYDTPVKQVSTYVHDDLVVAVLDIELTVIEQRMIDHGRGHLVHELRHAVQTAEAASFRAIVEHATGRRVVAFASHTHADPPFVAEGTVHRAPG